ncbi:MAG: FHA domain-containing protein, partial [Actinomycetota bacterium]|nr:FHA domain-containing protein [Actinomycetota bacterium]
MRIRMTVQEGGASREVLVEAAAGSTARDLATALGPGFSGARLRVDGRPVSVTNPLGMPPLLDGAVVGDGPVGAGGTDGAGGTGGSDTAPRPAAPGSGWELWVVSGPATGERLVLGSGTHLVGRAADTSLCLDDPDVSRRHLELMLGVEGVTMRDLGSANGTQLDGIPVGTPPTRAADGSVIVIGSSRLELHRSVRRSNRSAQPVLLALAHPDGAGHLLVDPRPAQAPRARPEPLAYPEPPPPPTRSRFPLVALLVPLALAGAIAALTHSPTMLLFGLSGPVLSLAAWWGQRRAGRSRRAATEHQDAVRLAELTLAGAAVAERLDLIAEHPPPSAVLRACEERSARLWNGETEVRVGLGPRTATPCFAGEGVPGSPVLEDAPLAWNPVGHLGVVGPRPLTTRAGANLLGRAAAQRSPHTLRVCVVTCSPADWEWVAMLPHARDGDENLALAILLAEIDTRANAPEGALSGEVLALVDLGGMRPGTASTGGGEGWG